MCVQPFSESIYCSCKLEMVGWLSRRYSQEKAEPKKWTKNSAATDSWGKHIAKISALWKEQSQPKSKEDWMLECLLRRLETCLQKLEESFPERLPTFLKAGSL